MIHVSNNFLSIVALIIFLVSMICLVAYMFHELRRITKPRNK